MEEVVKDKKVLKCFWSICKYYKLNDNIINYYLEKLSE